MYSLRCHYVVKMWLDPGNPPQMAGLHIPPIGSQLVHSLSIVYPLKLIRAGCGTRFRGMRSLTFAACGNKTLFSIIFTTSTLAQSWIRAWVGIGGGCSRKRGDFTRCPACEGSVCTWEASIIEKLRSNVICSYWTPTVRRASTCQLVYGLSRLRFDCMKSADCRECGIGSRVDRKSCGPEVTLTGSHTGRKSRVPEATSTGSSVGRK